jgi:hypothetical protein
MGAEELFDGIRVRPLGSVAITAFRNSTSPSAVRAGKLSTE